MGQCTSVVLYIIFDILNELKYCGNLKIDNIICASVPILHLNADIYNQYNNQFNPLAYSYYTFLALD